MNTPSLRLHNLKKVTITLLIGALLVSLSPASPTQAESISDLQKQQAALEQQAALARQQAAANKTLAERASDRLQAVKGQIQNLQSSIQSTESNIGSTSEQIAKKDQELADLQATLRQTKDQEDAIIRQLYMTIVSQPDQLNLFSNESISKQEQEKAHLAALQKTAALIAARTKQSQLAVQQSLDDLNQKQRTLTALKNQQTEQQQGLASVQQQQSALATNAEAAQQQFEAQASQAQAKAAQIAQRVKVLLATANWGSQIVSSNDGSWYYRQTDYNTRMGNSYATVHDYGCLITSVAMVATYYGRPTSPDYIARNGSFTSDGSYYNGTPAGLGVILRPGGAVNWNTVQNEIAKGRPVIISIYLSSVGALNSDGSSHFIVVKGYENGKYLMHDPLGSGRSYNLNQVRSMILTTPN